MRGFGAEEVEEFEGGADVGELGHAGDDAFAGCEERGEEDGERGVFRSGDFDFA